MLSLLQIKMDQAAKLAQEGGYDYFTTTLTISPLKNAAWLNELGQKAGELAGVRFLPSDFKKKGGYQRSIQLSNILDTKTLRDMRVSHKTQDRKTSITKLSKTMRIKRPHHLR